MDFNDIVANEWKLKGYPQKTIDTYLHHSKKFVASGKTPRDSLIGLIAKDYSEETVRSASFAVRFYLNTIRKDSSEIQDVVNNLPNIRSEKKLPVVLSKEEIERLVSSKKNMNHRLIIQVGYSAGLRVSEIINLTWKDIDFDRNHVRPTVS